MTYSVQLQEFRSQLRHHVQAASTLLQNEATSAFWEGDGKWIRGQIEQEKWSQVLMGIERVVSTHQFSSELLNQLSKARHAKNSHAFLVAQEMLRRTSDADKQVIGECLHALAHGPFITYDGELHAVTGLWREELAQIAEAWPDIQTEHKGWVPNFEFPDFVSRSIFAVQGTLNNLLGYPHHQEKEWSKHISTPQAQVEQVFENWRHLRREIVGATSGI